MKNTTVKGFKCGDIQYKVLDNVTVELRYSLCNGGYLVTIGDDVLLHTDDVIEALRFFKSIKKVG